MLLGSSPAVLIDSLQIQSTEHGLYPQNLRMDALTQVQVEEGTVTACSPNRHLHNADAVQALNFSNRMKGSALKTGQL